MVDKKKSSPLHWACRNGYFEIVKVLVEAGADRSLIDCYRYKPGHWAHMSGYDDIFEYLSK